jgi:uncharacterized pyridoxamine 5'-phosphate oxidase family protein
MSGYIKFLTDKRKKIHRYFYKKKNISFVIVSRNQKFWKRCVLSEKLTFHNNYNTSLTHTCVTVHPGLRPRTGKPLVRK